MTSSLHLFQPRVKVQKNKREFRTVVPMRVTTIETRNPRPQIIRCPECGGDRVEQVMANDGVIYEYPCLFCDSRGYIVRNASRVEHRSLVERLGAWSLGAIKAVIL